MLKNQNFITIILSIILTSVMINNASAQLAYASGFMDAALHKNLEVRPHAEVENAATRKISPIKWGFESDFNSGYIWKGIGMQDAITWNPSVTLGIKNFSVNVWENLPVHFNDPALKPYTNFNEIDLNLSYEIRAGVSYTSFTNTSNIYKAFMETNMYHGQAGVFQGFYLGPVGFYINPEINYYPYLGGVSVESGFHYVKKNAHSKTNIYMGYVTANQVFTANNIRGIDDVTYNGTYKALKLEFQHQFNFKRTYIRPHVSYYHHLNYSELLGYKEIGAIGVAFGIN